MRTGSTIPPRPKNNIETSLGDILGPLAQQDRQRLLEDIGRLEADMEMAREAFWSGDNVKMRKALRIKEE